MVACRRHLDHACGRVRMRVDDRAAKPREPDALHSRRGRSRLRLYRTHHDAFRDGLGIRGTGALICRSGFPGRSRAGFLRSLLSWNGQIVASVDGDPCARGRGCREFHGPSQFQFLEHHQLAPSFAVRRTGFDNRCGGCPRWLAAILVGKPGSADGVYCGCCSSAMADGRAGIAAKGAGHRPGYRGPVDIHHGLYPTDHIRRYPRTAVEPALVPRLDGGHGL